MHKKFNAWEKINIISLEYIIISRYGSFMKRKLIIFIFLLSLLKFIIETINVVFFFHAYY